jgi:hypothetical protein
MPDTVHSRQMAASQAQDAELRLNRMTDAEMVEVVRQATDRLAEYEARIEALEALLREALQWCPRIPTNPTSAKRQAIGNGWVDLGNRIEAVLAETAGLTEGPK